ncbi:hypothetical protein ABH920_006986 [Catenulispora sp. EB89]
MNGVNGVSRAEGEHAARRSSIRSRRAQAGIGSSMTGVVVG